MIYEQEKKFEDIYTKFDLEEENDWFCWFVLVTDQTGIIRLARHMHTWVCKRIAKVTGTGTGSKLNVDKF